MLFDLLNVSVNGFVACERERPEGDTWGAIHNLFDEDYSDYAPIDKLEHDFPRGGISYIIEAQYKL